MTECERFVKEGLFTTDFFKEEVRCDFLVTTERKKIWAVELDLLRQFDVICKKHGLNYWVMYGALLGAVRHKGFIPWDDDLDVVMLREDYEKLLKLSTEFTFPYFLQIPTTDPNSFFSYAKLRNSRTTCVHKKFAHRNLNMGILMDIFPLDNFIVNGDAQTAFDRIKWLIMENSTYMRMGNPNLSKDDKERVAAWSGINPWAAYGEMQLLARRFENVPETRYVYSSSVTVYPLAKAVYERKWFLGTEYLPFEGFLVRAPVMCRPLLEVVYGEYMKFPPLEKRGTWHSDIIFDPDRPYTEYLRGRIPRL